MEIVGLWWRGQGECGGEGFCLVGACTGAWHMCCHHCLFICSRRCHLCTREFVLWFLAQGMYRICGFSLLVANSSLWEMAFPRVSGLALQLLGQLLEAGSTEHTCALILLRTMICLGRLVVMLFPAFRCEPEN